LLSAGWAAGTTIIGFSSSDDLQDTIKDKIKIKKTFFI
jgi:hypothetical protein